MDLVMERDAALASRQLDNINNNAWFHFLFHSVNASIVALLLWQVGADQRTILSWFSALMLTICYQLWLNARYHFKSNYSRGNCPTIWRYWFSSLLISTIWGLSSVIFIAYNGLAIQLVLAFILASIAASSIYMLAPIKRLYLWNLVLLLSPITLQMLLLNHAVERLFGVLLVLFAISLGFIATWCNRTFCNAVDTDVKLAQLARVDELTGLAHRRWFDLCLGQEWSRGLRQTSPLSVLLIDIDHFNAYNNYYGHSAGDHCLVEIARILTIKVRRPADVIARFGGGVFAVILAQTSWSGAIHVAEKIRNAVIDLHIPHASSPIAPYVTVTIGVAVGIPVAGSSVEELLAMADAGLYQGKRNGRNQVDWSVNREDSSNLKLVS